MFACDFGEFYNTIDLTGSKEKKLQFFGIHSNTDANNKLCLSLFQFVIQDNYFYNGNKVFRQILDTPMGRRAGIQF